MKRFFREFELGARDAVAFVVIVAFLFVFSSHASVLTAIVRAARLGQ